jgi:hypothetical protein
MAAPPGWLDHRQFILRVGAQLRPHDWTGREHMALHPARESADRSAAIERISDRDAAAVYDRHVEVEGIDAARTAAAAPGGTATGGGVCAICGEAATKIIAGAKYCAEHGEALPRPDRLREWRAQHQVSLAADDEATVGSRAENGREILRQKIDPRDYLAETEARERWNFVYAKIRDQVFAGALHPAAWSLGEISYPPLDEWRAYYPRDLRVELPSCGFAWIIFREGDIGAAALAADSLRAPNSSAQKVPGDGRPGTPGPKTTRTADTVAKLVDRLRTGDLTLEELNGRTALSISREFSLGETTALKVRKDAIAQFRANGNSDLK